LSRNVSTSLISADHESPLVVSSNTATDLSGSSPDHQTVMGNIFPVSGSGDIGELSTRDKVSLLINPEANELFSIVGILSSHREIFSDVAGSVGTVLQVGSSSENTSIGSGGGGKRAGPRHLWKPKFASKLVVIVKAVRSETGRGDCNQSEDDKKGFSIHLGVFVWS